MNKHESSRSLKFCQTTQPYILQDLISVTVPKKNSNPQNINTLETEVHLHNIHNLVHITQSTHCPPFQPLCFKELQKCNLQQSSIKNTEIHFHFMLKCYTSAVRLIKHPSHFNVFTLSSRGYAAAELPKLRFKATHKFMFYNLIPTTV